ncbi:hypothetical protein CB1_000244003 [Camelus ferus]|nr:hypothetical protein CB1_000244003 [Camelus ferus]
MLTWRSQLKMKIQIKQILTLGIGDAFGIAKMDDGVDDLKISHEKKELGGDKLIPSAAVDHQIELLLSEWSKNADMLFSIHPMDGSLLVWHVDWLDEYQPGMFRQVQDPNAVYSELILWRVDPVGPLSFSGGVSELARINSLHVSAFSNVAWLPTLIPSYCLGAYCNSPSACFVASDGQYLRLYEAVIDAKKLLYELSSPEISKYVGEVFNIVSQQSTAQPGCIIALDPITKLYHPLQLLELMDLGKVRRAKAILSHLVKCIAGEVVALNEVESNHERRLRSLTISANDDSCYSSLEKSSNQETDEENTKPRVIDLSHLPGLSRMEQMSLMALADTVATTSTDIGESRDRSQGLSTSHFAWAFHSVAEEELLNMLPAMQKDDPTWSELRAMGVGWWVRNTRILRKCIEKVAKAAFYKKNDPLDAAIFYLAMKKKAVIWGLYRACLKILTVELRTLSTGYEIDDPEELQSAFGENGDEFGLNEDAEDVLHQTKVCNLRDNQSK